MPTLKKGMIITHKKNGDTRLIIETLGEIIFPSAYDEHNEASGTYTEPELRDLGYTWDVPAWEVEYEEMYFWISNEGKVFKSEWNNYGIDRERRDFLGIYQTEALALAARDKARAAVKSN